MFQPLLICLYLALVSSAKLKSSSETFETREKLVASSFWSDVSERRNSVLPQATSIFIQRDRAFMFISRVHASSWFRFGNRKLDVDMVEVRLGDGERQLEVKNYPLVTFSAALSSSGALIEREVSHGYSIKFSFELHLVFNAAQTGTTSGFGSQYQLTTSLSQSMVCRVNAGERGQLQASTRMMYYPNAVMRNVTHKSTGQFVNGKWEKVSSTVHGNEYTGALFYKSNFLGEHRCVTNPDYFEDALERTWVELK